MKNCLVGKRHFVVGSSLTVVKSIAVVPPPDLPPPPFPIGGINISFCFWYKLKNYLVGKRHFVVGCCSLTVVERIAVGQTVVVPSFVVVVEPFEFAKR